MLSMLRRLLLILIFAGGFQTLVFGSEDVTIITSDVSTTRIEILELWKSGKKREARSKLNKWKSAQKKSAEPWVVAAQFEFEEGRYKKCITMAQKALERNPLAADAYYWKGRSFEAMNKPMEAANELKAAILGQTSAQDAQLTLDRVLNGLALAPSENEN